MKILKDKAAGQNAQWMKCDTINALVTTLHHVRNYRLLCH